MIERDLIKKRIIELITNKEDLLKYCDDFKSTHDVIELLWAAESLVNEGALETSDGIKIAKKFITHPDPKDNDEYDLETRRGDDVRIIVTVRATLAWFIKSILVKFNSNDFEQLFELIVKLADFEEEKNSFVRKHSTVPLSVVTHNLYAKKRGDGSSFEIPLEVKVGARGLALRMLDQNIKYPRVLEYLVQVYDGLRDLDEEEALEVLNKFTYQERGILNPVYVTSAVAPLIIYYAEFRKDALTNKKVFNGKKIEELLFEVFKASDNQPELKATLIWLLYKALEEKSDSLPQLIKYIECIFDLRFQTEAVGQLDLLIEKVASIDPGSATILFDKYLQYIARGLEKHEFNREWLMIFHVGQILESISEKHPDKILSLLEQLHLIYSFYSDSTRQTILLGGLKQFSEKLDTNITDPQEKEKIRDILRRLPLKD